MAKLIGYARVSTRQQSTDRQEADLVGGGVRRDDLYVDQASRVPVRLAPSWTGRLAHCRPGTP